MNLYDIVKITTAKIADLAVTTAKVANNSITSQKFRKSAGLSVVGRNVNSVGDVNDIVAAADKWVLRRDGTSVGFGQVETNGIQNAAITAAKLSGAQTGAAPIFGIRAWVGFVGNNADGTNSIIEGSGNVSSVLKISTGEFRINFSTAMPNNDYIAFGMTGDDTLVTYYPTINLGTKTTSNFIIKARRNGALADFNRLYVAVVG
jgi:hypothetical protein